MAMIRTNGFVPLRRGLVEHVADGSMSINDAWLYISMLVNADPKNGIWIGSAEALALLFALDSRSCQRALQRLEGRSYIKRFFIRGKNGSFPVLIHRYECSIGSLKGKRLNANKSMSLTALVYYGVGELSDEVTDEVTDGLSDEVTPLFKRDMTQETREETLPPQKAAPVEETTSGTKGASLSDKDRSPKKAKAKEVVDERHKEFRAILGEYFASKNNFEMPWDGSEGKVLSLLLAANPKLNGEVFRALLRNRFKSDVNHSERPRAWLSSATDYAGGSLDHYGKPKGDVSGRSGNGRHASNSAPITERVSAGVTAARAAAKRSADRAGGRADGEHDGWVSTSGAGDGGGGVPDGIRGSGPTTRTEESRDGPARVPDQPEIFPPSQRSPRGS